WEHFVLRWSVLRPLSVQETQEVHNRYPEAQGFYVVPEAYTITAGLRLENPAEYFSQQLASINGPKTWDLVCDIALQRRANMEPRHVGGFDPIERLGRIAADHWNQWPARWRYTALKRDKELHSVIVRYAAKKFSVDELVLVADEPAAAQEIIDRAEASVDVAQTVRLATLFGYLDLEPSARIRWSR